MATGNVTPTTAAVFLPTLWGPSINSYLETNLRLTQFIRDDSSLFQGSSRSEKVPIVAEETALTKTPGTDMTLETFTDTSVTLDLDTHIYKAKAIEDITRYQASEDLVATYSRNMAYAVAKGATNTIATALKASTTNNTDLTANNAMTLVDLQAGTLKLRKQDVDFTTGDCALWVNPEIFNSLISLDVLKQVNYSGNDMSAVISGGINLLSGMPVFSSTLWSSATDDGTVVATIVHRDAACYAFNSMPIGLGMQGDYVRDGRVRFQFGYNQVKLAHILSLDTNFGVKVLNGNLIVNFLNIG